MKNTAVSILRAGLAALFIILFASCEKEGTARFKGNYSFKTSGYIEIEKSDNLAVVPGSRLDTLILNLPDVMSLSVGTESGQMDISEVDPENGRILITMNVTGGDIVVLYARVENGKISIEPKKRFINIISGVAGTVAIEGISSADINTIQSEVVVSGEGVMYDNIILFDLKYEGWCNYAGVKYRITHSSIDCRAKVNE